MKRSRVITLLALLFAAASNVHAQQRPAPQRQPSRGQEAPRLYVEIDGAYRSSTQTLSDSATPTVYAETAQLTATYDVPAAPTFAGSAGFRLWRNFGIGVSVSSFSTSFAADITGSIPNPFQFNRARTFEGTITDLARKELALGAQLRGIFQLSPKFAVTVFGGPTRISVTQDVITALQYTEAYPYDTATFTQAQIVTDELSKWGFGGGADVAFYFTRNIGIGVGGKYNGGEVALVSLGGTGLTSKIGGTEFGGGLRVRF